jgi:acetylornithine aminotransferase
MTEHLMSTYLPLDISFEHGEGVWLWDDEGRRYLDAISGLGVCALGHAHPEVARVIADQAGKLIHTGNLFRIAWQEKLADRLARITGMDSVFCGNSGAEAIECALKIARAVGHDKGYSKPAVIVMEQSFHGRTMAALSASGSRKVQAGFEPLVSGFLRAPFGDLEALQAIARHENEITAVLVEPIQGEGGVRVPPPGYLQGLRALCDEHGWLLMVDEIQSGLCRSGKWYAHQHDSIVPDVLTSAKALANGLPIGACIAREEAAEILTPGRHGSTFGGNPLVARTACTVLDIMEAEDIAARAARAGKLIMDRVWESKGEDPRLVDIRGRGLMIGIELDRDANHLKQLAMDAGVLLNITQDRVIRLLPPLIIDDEQANIIAETVCKLVDALGED